MAADIAIVGEFDAERESHRQTTAAIGHLEGVVARWVPTCEIDVHGRRLAAAHGIVMAPGERYAHADGASAAITFARERGVPLVGT